MQPVRSEFADPGPGWCLIMDLIGPEIKAGTQAGLEFAPFAEASSNRRPAQNECHETNPVSQETFCRRQDDSLAAMPCVRSFTW